MKHHVSTRHLTSLAASQERINFKKSVRFVIDPKSNTSIIKSDSEKRTETQQAKTINHLRHRIGSFSTAVRIFKDVQQHRRSSIGRKKTTTKSLFRRLNKRKQGLALMKQLVAKPSVRSKLNEQSPQCSISSVGLNEEIFHSLESMKSLDLTTTAASSTFTLSLISYLHRMRIRDSPNINFVEAFKSIAVDQNKIKNLSMIQWKSTITQCFKKIMRNEHLKLIETIYHCYEEKHLHAVDGGAVPAASSMDVRYPLSALRVQSSLRLNLDPTTVAGEYQTKDTIVPLLMSHHDAKKHAENFMHIVWTTMCFHESHVSVHDLLHALKILVPHLDLRLIVLQASSPAASSQPFSSSPAAPSPAASSAPPPHRVTRQAFNRVLHQMTKYQHRIILHSCWNNVADFERCTKLVASLVQSQDRFIQAYIPMRLNSVNLKYRFNKIRPIFRAWRKYFDWIIAVRAKVLSVENARRIKALYHLHGVSTRMAAAHIYYKRMKPIAATNWLRVSFQRVRRITSRLREYKMKKLNKMAHIFFHRIHVRNCFRWWIDVYNEETKLPLAILHSDTWIQKYWFPRLLKYIRRQISDRKRDGMSNLFIACWNLFIGTLFFFFFFSF